MQFRKKSIIPGFIPTFGFTMFYLGIVVLIPLALLVIKSFQIEFGDFLDMLRDERVKSAFVITFSSALIAAILDAFIGLLIAWILVRYDFYGKKVIDSMIDFPFALPTAVAGIALAAIYSPNGLIGKYANEIGIQMAYNQTGIIIALTFIGLPFVVRSVEPVLQDMNREVEEAAASLGASRLKTFWMVIFPSIKPALLAGFAMAFARGLGEYGSVIFIAGNIPMVSEIVPLIIIIKLEQYQYAEASAIAVTMLIISFILLLSITQIQKLHRKNSNA